MSFGKTILQEINRNRIAPRVLSKRNRAVISLDEIDRQLYGIKFLPKESFIDKEVIKRAIIKGRKTNKVKINKVKINKVKGKK